MKRFNTITEVLIEAEGNVQNIMDRDVRKELLVAIQESGYYDDVVNYGFSVVMENDLTDKLFEGTLTNEELGQHINEASMKDWFKDKAAKIKDKASNTLTGAEKFIKKVGGKVASVASIIGKALSGFMSKAWDYIKNTVSSGLNKTGNKEKLEKTVSNYGEEDKKNLGSEVKNASGMFKAAVDWIVKGFPKQVATGAQGATQKVEVGGQQNEHYSWEEVFEKGAYLALIDMIKEDKNVIAEIESFEIEALNEGGKDEIQIPFISKIMHFITERIPPFNILHKIEKAAEKATGWALEKLSIKLSKVAKAPGPYKFPYMSKLAGLMVGKFAKTPVKELINFIAKKAISMLIISAAPGVGHFVSWLFTIAKYIWWLEVIEAALNLTVKTAGGEEAKKKVAAATSKTQIGGKATKAAGDAIDKAKQKVGDAAKRAVGAGGQQTVGA